jgi:hypothetical protein
VCDLETSGIGAPYIYIYIYIYDISSLRVNILILSFMKWDGPMDWTDLAQDMGRWLALVNAVTKSEFYKMWWNSCVAEEFPKKDCASWSLVS